MTSLKDCCLNGSEPDFSKQRFPFIIFQRFFRFPSDVLSGERKSKSEVFRLVPRSTLPISSEKSLSKKFTFSHVSTLSTGFNPVMVRQTQCETFCQKFARFIQSKGVKHIGNSHTACKNGASSPPVIQCHTVNDFLVPERMKNINRKMFFSHYIADFCDNPDRIIYINFCHRNIFVHKNIFQNLTYSINRF